MSKHYVRDPELCEQHADQACHRIEADLGRHLYLTALPTWEDPIPGKKRTGPFEAHIRHEIHDCSDHDRCTVIVTVQHGVLLDLDPVTFLDDEVRMESHMHSDVHAEHRLNDTYPNAVDHRGDAPAKVIRTAPCSTCVVRHGLQPEAPEPAEAS